MRSYKRENFENPLPVNIKMAESKITSIFDPRYRTFRNREGCAKSKIVALRAYL